MGPTKGRLFKLEFPSAKLWVKILVGGSQSQKTPPLLVNKACLVLSQHARDLGGGHLLCLKAPSAAALGSTCSSGSWSRMKKCKFWTARLLTRACPGTDGGGGGVRGGGTIGTAAPHRRGADHYCGVPRGRTGGGFRICGGGGGAGQHRAGGRITVAAKGGWRWTMCSLAEVLCATRPKRPHGADTDLERKREEGLARNGPHATRDPQASTCSRSMPQHPFFGAAHRGLEACRSMPQHPIF